MVYEAWCSQRPGNIIVMIMEIHGKPVKAGESFSAVHIVGYFDTIEDMHKVYEAHRGHTALTADAPFIVYTSNHIDEKSLEIREL